jgi:hypothetical protein
VSQRLTRLTDPNDLDVQSLLAKLGKKLPSFFNIDPSVENDIDLHRHAVPPSIERKIFIKAKHQQTNLLVD